MLRQLTPFAAFWNYPGAAPNSQSVNKYYADAAVWEQAEFEQREEANIAEEERLAAEALAQQARAAAEEDIRLDVDPIIFDPDALALKVEQDKVHANLEGREPKTMNDLIIEGLRFGAAKERLREEAGALRQRLGYAAVRGVLPKRNRTLDDGMLVSALRRRLSDRRRQPVAVS